MQMSYIELKSIESAFVLMMMMLMMIRLKRFFKEKNVLRYDLSINIYMIN